MYFYFLVFLNNYFLFEFNKMSNDSEIEEEIKEEIIIDNNNDDEDEKKFSVHMISFF